MKIRYLINNDGSPFESSEIQTLGSQLDALNDDTRREYRDNNASAIAKLFNRGGEILHNEQTYKIIDKGTC